VSNSRDLYNLKFLVSGIDKYIPLRYTKGTGMVPKRFVNCCRFCCLCLILLIIKLNFEFAYGMVWLTPKKSHTNAGHRGQWLGDNGKISHIVYIRNGGLM